MTFKSIGLQQRIVMDRPVYSNGELQQKIALWSQCRCYARYCLLAIDRGKVCEFWVTQPESPEEIQITVESRMARPLCVHGQQQEGGVFAL